MKKALNHSRLSLLNSVLIYTDGFSILSWEKTAGYCYPAIANCYLYHSCVANSIFLWFLAFRQL